jgi:hypothetical protein
MITTRNAIKTLLRISNTTNDTLIDTLIPIIQDDILTFLRNKFRTEIYQESNYISFSGNTILDSASKFVTTGYVAGNIVVEGSKLNDGFYTVTNVAAGILTISETLTTEAADNSVRVTQIIYPKTLELVAANMVGYIINAKYGVKSESFSRYSVTYQNDGQSLINGYPDGITRPLLKWRKPYND